MKAYIQRKEKKPSSLPFFSKDKGSFFSKNDASFFQNTGRPVVQTTLDDKHNLTSTTLAGNNKLEQCFDGEAKVKAPDNGDHVKRIQTGLVSLGFDLPEFGVDSKFGKETKSALVDFQTSVGMSAEERDGVVGKRTIGILDLSLRNSNIETDPDAKEKDFVSEDKNQEEKDTKCKGKPTDKACPVPNDSVNNAADKAVGMIDKVLTEQLEPVKNKAADYPAIFNKIFRFNDPGTVADKSKAVKDNFIIVKNFIAALKTNTSHIRCATECDGGCRSGSPGYHSNAGGKHIITFCPDFDTHADKILILIHESHHAAIDGSKDFAYPETRLFIRLDHNKALKNAASFHVYAALVDKPGSEDMGPKVPDTNTISDAAKKSNVNSALAFMEQWFRLIPFDISQTVTGTEEARRKGSYTDENTITTMEFVFSKWFGLTRPPAIPSKGDIAKLKAIEERANKMETAFKAPFVILETADNSFWERGPGSGIALNNALLDLDLEHMTIALLQELVHATPDISADIEALYVGALNDLRNMRNLDP